VKKLYLSIIECALMPQPRAFEIKLAIEELLRHRSPGTNQIPAELIKTMGKIISSEIHKLINSIWNKKDFLGS
jgi:hypothetical protein